MSLLAARSIACSTRAPEFFLTNGFGIRGLACFYSRGLRGASVDVDASDVAGVVSGMLELQGSRLRRYREQAGLSQVAVAEALGVSQPSVARWELANDPGERWPELARLYGVGENQLGAPFNPERRLAWQQERSAGFATRSRAA